VPTLRCGLRRRERGFGCSAGEANIALLIANAALAADIAVAFAAGNTGNAGRAG